MKNIVILFALSICTSLAQTPGAGSVQNPPVTNQKFGPDRRQGGPLEELGMTPEQKTALVPILQGVHAQVEAIKSDTTLTAQQKTEKLNALHESIEPQIQSVLTPEQKSKLAALKAAHKDRMPGQEGGRPFDALNLTQEQKAALAPILQGVRAQVESIKADTTLAMPEKMNKLKAVHESMEPQVQAILTPAQKAQLEQMKAAHKQGGPRGPATN